MYAGKLYIKSATHIQEYLQNYKYQENLYSISEEFYFKEKHFGINYLPAACEELIKQYMLFLCMTRIKI